MKWQKIIKRIFQGDSVIWTIFLILCAISIVEVFSASSILTLGKGNPWKHVIEQTEYVFFGLCVALVAHLIPHKFYQILGSFGLLVSWILLVWVLFKGEEVNGASRAITIFGVGFQPLELAKLTLVLTIATMMSRVHEKGWNIQKIFWWIIGLTGVTCLLIFKENLSTAILIGFVVCLFMWVGQLGAKRMTLLTTAGLITAVGVFLFIKNPPAWVGSTNIDRFVTWSNRLNFVSPKDDGVAATDYQITDQNRQFTHAQIAIATGGIVGKMPGKSEQRDLLSNGFSDYIYAIIIEETGLIGGAFVLFLYLILLYRAMRLAKRCHRTFPAFVVMGLSLMMVVQALMSMAVAVGWIHTGQPLPLISKGGTSMLISAAYIGIILSVSRYIEAIDRARQEESNATLVSIEQQEAVSTDTPFASE
ncbi:MAG: FtsW/RodA/SpoVE family cell cycle protein [Prevotellaceae bacterium]|jgi:cell division protein FtsW|nr:FtsW/RodA/SpoVE family cell cycle protein [Prevotellaceae bacterium]